MAESCTGSAANNKIIKGELNVESEDFKYLKKQIVEFLLFSLYVYVM